MNRRSFLSRLALGTTGLLVGDAALEAFERLTHRKVFALGGLPPVTHRKIGATFLRGYGEWVTVSDDAVLERVGDVELMRSRYARPSQLILIDRRLLRPGLA